MNNKYMGILVFGVLLTLGCTTNTITQNRTPNTAIQGWYGDLFYRGVQGISVSINGYNGNGGLVEIPSEINGIPVTAIGIRAFAEKNLTDVIIPDSITTIGDEAFKGNQLTNLIIPNSVTTIGNMAFSKNQLTSVIISERISELGGFSENKLTSVIIPNGVTTIRGGAFMDNLLTDLVIPDSVIFIGDMAFKDNPISILFLSNNLVSIGLEAFEHNELTHIVIPDSVSIIRDGAFSSNTGTTIIIDTNTDERKTIERRSSNRITKITIGSNVEIPGWPAASFAFHFNDFYNENGRKAGTYIYSNDIWRLESATSP